MTAEKPRVLLVDDDPNLVKILSKRLEVVGFDVHSASDGKMAIEKASAEQPDVLILDLAIPERSGLEVCSAIRKDPRCRNVRIVLYSGREEDDVLARFKQDQDLLQKWGADAFVNKADGTEVLIREVKRALERSQETPPSGQDATA